MKPVTIDPRYHDAVIFDLDGFVADIAALHAAAWKKTLDHEFHWGYPDRPYEGMDNNAYTTVMAVWVILRAMDALKLMPLPSRLDLPEKLGLKPLAAGIPIQFG